MQSVQRNIIITVNDEMLSEKAKNLLSRFFLEIAEGEDGVSPRAHQP